MIRKPIMSELCIIDTIDYSSKSSFCVLHIGDKDVFCINPDYLDFAELLNIFDNSEELPYFYVDYNRFDSESFIILLEEFYNRNIHYYSVLNSEIPLEMEQYISKDVFNIVQFNLGGVIQIEGVKQSLSKLVSSGIFLFVRVTFTPKAEELEKFLDFINSTKYLFNHISFDFNVSDSIKYFLDSNKISYSECLKCDGKCRCIEKMFRRNNCKLEGTNEFYPCALNIPNNGGEKLNEES